MTSRPPRNSGWTVTEATSRTVLYHTTDGSTDVYFNSGESPAEMHYSNGWHGPFDLGAPIS